jgi:hypothetical protein
MCTVHGRGAIDLVKAIKNVGFQEAVDWLKTLAGAGIVSKPVEKPSNGLQIGENLPFKATYEKYAVPCIWLKERGVTQATLDRFEVDEHGNLKAIHTLTDEEAACIASMKVVRRLSSHAR